MWPFNQPKHADSSLTAEVISAIQAASIQTRDTADEEGKPRLLVSLRCGVFYWHDQGGITAALRREFPDLSAAQVARSLRMLHDRVIEHNRNEIKDAAANRPRWRDSWRPLEKIDFGV